MSITREDKDGSATLKIEGSMSIYDATAVRVELLACFDNSEDITLDLKRVTDFDTAGLQLLCAARKTAAEEGKRFCVAGAPAPVIDFLRDAGVNPEELFNLEFEVELEKED